MEEIDIEDWDNLPSNFTGMVHYHLEGNYPAAAATYWFKEGRYHREDGPAVEWADGEKQWWLEDKQYKQINLSNYVVLDHYQGKYDLIWYKFLGEDKVFEYPDIPGLIIKE